MAAKHEEISWERRLCWNNSCLPKAGTFMWLAGNEKILSGDRMMKMGLLGPFRCCLCKKEEETVDHMLLNCEYSQEIWRFGLGKLGWQGPLLDTLKKWLEAYCFNPRRSVISDI